ncbi:MAG: hypothetical protein ACQEXQ_22795 [Bacillota bacterium]
MSQIQVIGASIHNLKKINVTLPKGKFIVFTGVTVIQAVLRRVFY